jgi:hypothetical protein
VGSIFFRGFSPTLYNGVAHVPYLKHRLDPALYPGDLLIAAHENYYSLLWELVVGLSSVLPLMASLFVFYVIQQLLFHTAIAALAYRLGRSVLFTLVCNVYFMIWLNPGLGGSNWTSLTAAHSSFSFPFFVFAIVALLDRRVLIAAALWGIGTQFHLPNAVYCAPMIGILGIWALATEPKGQVMAVLQGALAVVIAGGALMWAHSHVLAEDAKQLALTMEELRVLTRNRVGPHIFIGAHFTGSTAHNAFKVFLTQGVIFGVIVALAWKTVPVVRLLLMGMAGLIAVLVMGILATEVLNSVSIARLMLLRVADFIGFLFLLVPLALGGAWMAGRLPASWLGLPFFLAFFFAGSESWEGNRHYFRGALIVLLVSVVLCWWLRSERRAAWLAPLGNLLPQWWRAMPGSVQAVLLFLLIGLPGMSLAIFEEYRSSGSRRDEAFEGEEARAWLDVQEWGLENTPKEEVFLTPPLRFGWRTHSERGSFLELRDGNPIVLNNNIHGEFRRRAAALGIHLDEHVHTEKIPTHLFEQLGERELAALGATEGIRYAVLDIGHDCGDLPVVYSNKLFKIVSLVPPPLVNDEEL